MPENYGNLIYRGSRFKEVCSQTVSERVKAMVFPFGIYTSKFEVWQNLMSKMVIYRVWNIWFSKPDKYVWAIHFWADIFDIVK